MMLSKHKSFAFSIKPDFPAPGCPPKTYPLGVNITGETFFLVRSITVFQTLSKVCFTISSSFIFTINFFYL